MKASILIPVFNRAASISRTLTSVKKNKNTLEIIVVDDCSTDNTEQVVKDLNLDNLIYIKLKEKKNGNVARNLAAKVASGDILIFLDSDDEFCEGRVDQLLNYFHEKTPDIVVDTFVTEKKGGKTSFEFKNLSMDSGALFNALVCNAIPLTFSSISVRRDKFVSMGFLDESTHRHQDRDFIFTALSQERSIHLRNAKDVIKHQSTDSFSRSAIGYMAALAWVAQKHEIFNDQKYSNIRKYLIMRSLIDSILRFDIKTLFDNYKVYRLSNLYVNDDKLSIASYFLGRSERKLVEKHVVENLVMDPAK